jgi:hypothetical protein
VSVVLLDLLAAAAASSSFNPLQNHNTVFILESCASPSSSHRLKAQSHAHLLGKVPAFQVCLSILHSTADAKFTCDTNLTT